MPNVPISAYKEINGLVFTSGQIHLKNGVLLEGNATELTRQVMENLQVVLVTAQTSFKNVLKTTIYLTDMSCYGEVNEVYASYFNDSYPAREVIGVKELPLGARIEISLIATK